MEQEKPSLLARISRLPPDVSGDWSVASVTAEEKEMGFWIISEWPR